ncbi:peptidoglycan-binding protein [Streptomyces sp. NPDC093261]|uniref:peptidoglycan-binding domain-containing protein n=1 Tax=Streptomyces sp. NPDC093261 TaxID=3366037 RepID=UPI0037FB0D35
MDETVRLGVVPAADASGQEPPRRRRRTVLLASGGAVTVAAAAFVGGLLSYHPPQRDGALPGDIRASVPEKSSQGGTSAPESTVAPPPTTPTAPSPSTSPTPSLSRSSASVPPSASPAPSRTATATASRSPGGGGQQYPVQVLRPGDEGPGVDELQLRLRQLNLYTGVVNGVYDGQVEFAVRRYQIARGITQDDPGVYGPQTKAELESETGTGAGAGKGTGAGTGAGADKP